MACGDIHSINAVAIAWWMNKRVATTTMVTTQQRQRLMLLLLLCLSGSIAAAQQLFIARPQRSIYGAPPLGPSGPPASLGWNSVGSFNPLSFGHMTKDELLTLLEAWQEVEEESAPPPTPAPEPVEKPAPPPPPKRPIRPPPRPRPPAPPAAAGAGAAAGGGGGGGGGGPAVPPPGTPVQVRLPAFVPIQLSAMYTPPLAVIGGGGGGGGAAAAAAAAAAGGGGGNGGAAAAAAAAAAGGGGGGGAGVGGAQTFDSDFPDIDDEDAAQPRLFRYMQLPMTLARPQSQPQPHPRAAAPPPPSHVMRNTLESVDAGIAPLSNFVNVKSKTANFRPPMSLPIKPPTPSTLQGPVIRPRFLMPPSLPYLANAPGPLELVPSSQIIGDWRE